MKLPRRQFLRLAAGAATLPAVSRIAKAQAYPSRPVRIIVGQPAGGGVDITARVIGQWLSERFGQQFVIENRPGAGSNIAAEAVVRAPPDGYSHQRRFTGLDLAAVRLAFRRRWANQPRYSSPTSRRPCGQAAGGEWLLTVENRRRGCLTMRSTRSGKIRLLSTLLSNGAEKHSSRQSLDCRGLRIFVELADCAGEFLLVAALICGPRPKMMLYVTGS
jgi:tripartite tricarboxylate transporter family receptor